jgi:hypothetical protein
VSRVLLGLLGLVLAGCAASAAGERHLVLISLDGLRPEFYLDPASPAAELRALVAAGSAARGAEPVFPSVTYPNHATIVTGVRPMRHGIAFNVLFDPTRGRGRWYEEAADLRAPPLWEWARSAGLRTAGVSWPVTLGAGMDLVMPERDYYARSDPLPLLREASTPGLFERLGVSPEPAIFKDVVRWDAFLTAVTMAIIRQARPHLLLVHLIQLDYFQHRVGREGAEVKPALARVDAHVGAIRRALAEAGLAERSIVIVTGDHGFQDVHRTVYPNEVLARAGLGGCPWSAPDWKATAHNAGGAAGVFVNPPGDAYATAAAEAALRQGAGERYTVLTRGELDALGAMPGAAFGLEPAPGYIFSGTCGKTLDGAGRGGTHGYLPSRPSMATGFIAAGAGVRAGVMLEGIQLMDIAPTAARLLGVPAPPVEGRVLQEILR